MQSARGLALAEAQPTSPVASRDDAGRARRRRAAGWAWSVWFIFAALMLPALLLLALLQDNGGLALGLSLVVVPTVGALVASRRPDNPIGWLLLAMGLAWAIAGLTGTYAQYALVAERNALPGVVAMAWLASWTGIPALGVLPFVLLLFPTGRLLDSGWRPVAWLVGVALALDTIATALVPGPLHAGITPLAVNNPFGVVQASDLLTWIGPVTSIGCILLPIASVILRFRRARGVERQQLKVLTYAAGAFAILILLSNVGSLLPEALRSYYPGAAIFGLAVAVVPAGIGLAILRYRLWDIDVLIGRTLVYGGLTATIVGTYVLVVGYLGAMFQARGDAVSLVAAGLVAVVVQPVREALQRGVNRLLFGQRDEPYTVLSRLGQRLEATLAPEAVLPTVVDTVREALRLPYTAITVWQDGRLVIAAESGRPVESPLQLPLVYQNDRLGELVLGPRAPGDAFTAADHRLLVDLARQTGIAVHAARLTSELQQSNEHLRASRERLVTAREEERRRLRRDLHDGLGPQLAGFTLRLDAARNLLRRDADRAASLLQDLADRTQDAVSDIRRLVDGLRPPALDELGLVAALRHYSTQSENGGPRITIEAANELPTLSAAVEVAAYRIATAGLTNVVRHADAATCVVRIAVDQPTGFLCLEVVDDGRGLPAQVRAGVGLTSMRERAEELGGSCVVHSSNGRGTTVSVRLPYAATPSD